MKLFKYFQQLFHFVGFKSYLYSGFLTSIANWNYIVAMTTLIYLQFGTSGVAIFALIRQVPYILMSPFSGYLIDKFPRKTLIIFINSLNVISMIILALSAFMDMSSIALYLVVAIIQVFVGTIDYPIRATIGKKLVDKESLLALNTLTTSLGTVALMIAPIISGLFLGLNNLFWVFLINCIIYLICLGLVILIPKTINENNDVLSLEISQTTILNSFKNIVEGFKYIVLNKKIFAISIILCFIHIVVGSVFVFAPYLADVTGQGNGGTGYYLAANGLGCVIGTLVGGHIGKTGLIRIILLSVFGTFIACLICGGINATVITYFSVLLIGFFTMLPEAPIMTVIQEETPDYASGRVWAAIDVLIIGGMGLGSLLMGWLFANISFMLTLFIVGVLPIVVLLLLYKSLKLAHGETTIDSPIHV